MENGIRTEGLKIGFPGKKGKGTVLAEGLELTCRKGELVALVGPNGCGKSTLLRTIAGLQEPLAGGTYIDGQAIEERRPKERARLLSIVLTGMNAPSNLSVRDLVSLGRSPYRSAFMPLTRSDQELVQEALEQTNIPHLAEKTLDTLSDGEAQKTMIARALAQRTKAVVLDEPTAHLDLINRVEIARMLRELARERKEAIVMASHDLETILRIVDRVWLMDGQGKVREGIPEKLAMKGTFSEVFASEKLVFDQRTGSFRFLEEACGTLSLEGDGTERFWTEKALERIGYEVRKKAVRDERADIRIEDGKWFYGSSSYSDLQSLIEELAP
jgi:iron complex transport system ATP-binding protein